MTRFTSLCIALAATASLVAAQSAATCPEIRDYDVQPCGKCTKDNFREGFPLCAFCYATKSCVEVQGDLGTLLHGPCPAVSPSPGVSPSIPHGSMGKEASSADYSLGLDGECDCRPDTYTSCQECASASHLGCTWISNGTREQTFEILGVSMSVVQNISNTCATLQTTAGEIKTYEVLNSAGELVMSLSNHARVTEFFWAQCVLDGLWFPVAVMAFIGLCGLACVCCVACCSLRRLRQRRRHRLQQPLVRYVVPAPPYYAA